MKKWGIMGVCITISVIAGFSFTSAALQESVDSDLKVNVGEVLALTIIGCGDGTTPQDVRLETTPKVEGSFSSCPLTAKVSTNAPGFKLSMQGIDTATYGSPTTNNPYFDGTNDNNVQLVRTYMNVTEQIDLTNKITSHTGTIASPTAITNPNDSTWGFAIPKTQANANDEIGLLTSGFDSTYSTISDSATTDTGLYAKMPTTSEQIKDYPNFSTTSNDTSIFFGTRTKVGQAPGLYKGTVLFSATPNKVPPVPEPLKWKQIAAGGLHTCALDTAGAVYCWGRNIEGQLGDNKVSGSQSPVPVAVNTTDGFTDMNGKIIQAITAGYSHTCALDTAGAVYCWGYNDGRVGDNSNINRLTPVAVNTTDGFTDMNGKIIQAITAGDSHTCALDTAGAVYCWGRNNYGQLGDNTSGIGTNKSTPVAVNTVAGTSAMNGKTIKAITTKNSHTCALDTAGAVYCWGWNMDGQLGDNKVSGSQSSVPVAVNTTAGAGVMNGKIIQFITTGYYHTCALDTAGAVYCWGDNSSGQLGDNTNINRLTPVAVNTTGGSTDMNGKTIQAISAGYCHTCALDTVGVIYCWGWNYYGQLGDNTSGTNRLTPVAVISPHN